jgi:hypothetical protein
MNRLIGAFMASSRTFKTLTALLAAMTVGAFALIVMGTAPHTPALPLAAVNTVVENGPTRVICETDTVLRTSNWRNVVVHLTSSLDSATISEAHFVIVPAADGSDDVLLKNTPLWRAQKSGTQVYSLGDSFNDETIGVVLVGDFTNGKPSQEQFDRLMHLVRSLQRHFHVGADRVYLPNDIDPRFETPVSFPAKAFHHHLLR